MTGTGQDPLIRLADELGHLGRRLEAVGQELHRVGSTQAVATLPAPPATAAAGSTAGTSPTSTSATSAPTATPAQPAAPAAPAQPAAQPTAAAQSAPAGQAASAPQQTPVPQPAAAAAQTAQAPAHPTGPATHAPAYQAAPRPAPHPSSPAQYTAAQHPYAPPQAQGAPGWGQPAPYWPPTPPPPPGPTLFDRLGKDGAGSKFLAWVGGAVTLLGVVLLLVLAVQRGYLGPLPRVLGGAALGAVLVGLGLWLHRTPAGRTGAFALAATGIAVLYLDVIAATSIYEYLPGGGGLAAGLLIAGGGLLLALRWDSAALAIGVVAACAVCAPVITQGFTPLLVAFLLVLKIAASPVHLKRDWPWLAVTAGVPPLLASVLVIGRTDEYTLAGISLLAAVIGVAAAVLTINVRPGDTTALALAVGSPLPALLTTAVLDRTTGAGVAGAVAVLMLALWAAGRRSLPKNFTAAVGAVGVFALFQATTIALDGSTRAAVVLAEALVLAFLAKVLSSRGPLLGSLVFGAIGFLLTIAAAVPPRLLLDEPWRVDTPGFLVSGMLTSLVLGVLVVVLPWVATGLGVLGRHPFPWIVTGVVLLYAAAGVVLCGALLVSQDVTGFLFGHSIVTVSWTVAALVLLVRGIDRKSLRVAGLVLVGAAVAKLLLFDMAALDGIARVLAFIGAGLVLLTAGTRYAKLVATRRISADS
ncbi:hypothetical protein ADK67_01615 [Saccharothrix sp. NRRL B-16348]|uniref:DUF2339 domain-containing protein n=1 Tax=Saccharothrix sp. NRRL B-16348 TaxID=1415542 RepID=UPI0006C4BE48|nr:DUF2339 domain-containing protein [Saccharothrix sp. NRRL B-16348]KOX35183.1 hypothetical protein ADK67_01615 [Saccharothrix sp. NRRL B-16348]